MAEAGTLEEVAELLYALPPEDFTAARDAAAKEAKGAGDGGLAAAVKALRRPTVSAWLVDRLVRERPDAVGELLDLGGRLRDAQAAAVRGDAGDLRALTEERRALVVRLAGEAVAGADRDVAPAVQLEVAGTLDAALASSELAAAVTSGRLVKAVQYAGFGEVPDLDDLLAGAVPAAGATQSAEPGKPGMPGKREKPEEPGKPETPGSPAAPGKTAGPGKAERDAAAAATRRLAEAETAALDAMGAADDATRALTVAQQRAEWAAADREAAQQAVLAAEAALRQAKEARDLATEEERAAGRAATRALRAAEEAHRAADKARERLDRLRRGS